MRNIWKTFIQEVFTWKYMLFSVFIAFLYISFTVYLLNYRFVLGSLFGDYSLVFKARVLVTLLEGIFTAFSKLDATLLIITGILIGINISLLFIATKRVRGQKLKLFVGGGSVLGLISTGCASCGLSVLSLLGLGASLSSLPFGSKTLYIFSIGTLLFSIYYTSKQLANADVCDVKIRSENDLKG